MLIAVGIKALNEEQHIARTIESALAAVQPFNGKVVLADSGSTDATVEIASRYPIDIVQLANPAEKCCGAGAQLAFQASADADFFYLLDGDMELDGAFLKAALARLHADPTLAGVCGTVVQCNMAGPDFRIRAQKASYDEAEVDRLDCGGLYRTPAITTVGYFADRNLHAFEEFELGARLTSRGWRLLQLGQPAVYHHGHLTGGYHLLWRRLLNGYAGGAGEVLRASIGQPHLKHVLLRLRHLHVAALVAVWWVALAFASLSGSWGLLFLLVVAPLAILIMRRRSLSLGLYSLVSWNVGTVGVIGGFFRRPVSPSDSLAIRHLGRSTKVS